MQHTVSRRGFLAGTAVAAGATAMASIARASESKGVDGKAASATVESAPSDWLGTAPTINPADVSETVECEVLVVGAGQSGSACASFAAAGGADTLWIEANANGNMMRSSAISGINTKYQKAVNVSINPEDILNDMTHYALNQCSMKLWRDWVDHSAEAVEWYGGEVEKSGQQIDLEYTMPPEGRYQTWPTGHGTATTDPLPDNPNDPSVSQGDEAAVWAVVEADFDANGGVYRNNTRLVELIQDPDGKVTGAYASTADGKYVQINASKGVVIATGGYVNNADMFRARQCGLEKCLSGNLNWGTCLGDGIKACLWAGAHMDAFPTTMVFDRGVIKPDTENGQVFDGGEFQYTNFCSQPFLKVDCTGKRICNESSPYDFIVHASMELPDHSWYPIWDSSWKDDVQAFMTIGCSTLFSRTGSNHHAPGLDTIEETLDGFVESGFAVKADTLEELAEGLGFDVDTFVQTVETYNGYCANGYDAQFGKEAYRLTPVDEPPYYGMKVGGLPLCTLDGIVINDDYQAVDDEGKAIDGLYVIGNDSGCCYAHTYPNFGAGTNAGRCATAGMLVGRALSAK